MSDDQNFDENDLRSLGRKLAELDLTDRERAAMAALLSDDDVAGFGRYDIIPGIQVGYQDGTDLFFKTGVRGPSGDPGVRAERLGLRAQPKPGEYFKPGRF